MKIKYSIIKKENINTIEFSINYNNLFHIEKDSIDKNNARTTTRNGELTLIDGLQKENSKESTSNVDIISSVEKQKLSIRKIDFMAFVVGLLLFLLFNLVYWLTFSLYEFN